MTMPIIRNRVLLLLLAIGVAAIAVGGFVAQAPNRLVSGRPIALWSAVDGAKFGAIASIAVLLFAIAFLPLRKAMHWTVIALAVLLIMLLFAGAGGAAAKLTGVGGPVARTALGAGFWVSLLCAGLIIADALQRLGTRPSARLLVAIAAAGAIALMARSGTFDALSIVKEFQQRRAVFATECARHCGLAASAIGLALLIGVPLGIAVARRPALGGPTFASLNLVQAIPSLALFGLLISPLSALGSNLPALGSLGVSGIGVVPALIALVFYALLPVVRNTHAGIMGVDSAIIESAKGMGLTNAQILWKVEMPLAAPMLLAGLRIVAVQAIGLTVVAALIGAGGLGTFVFQGLGQYATDLVLLGALPVILLALSADLMLSGAAAMFVRT